MCGIIGYAGFRDARNVLIDCLKRLDYRGYDSAGVGIVNEKLHIFKEVGEIANLEKNLPKISGNVGIGHTRWATHGKVSKENAHPHTSQDKKIAIVHNGIIENFKKLKSELERKGHKFSTETDTEVIAHQISEEYNGNLEKAILSAIKKIQGSYAIVAVCENEPNKVVGVRKESPLVIGLGDNENFIASDIPALLKYTNRVVYLDDGELCVINNKSLKIFDNKNKPIKKRTDVINWDISDAEKSGFPHFMLKEIYDQPDSLNQVLIGRASEINRSIEFDESVEGILNNKIDSIQIIACGTSFYTGIIGKYLIEQLTNIPTTVELASEYRFFGSKSSSPLVIAISQSGETADTLAALREAKNRGCTTLVITNIIGSTATRISDSYILQQSGPEIGVAATKTFTSQLIVLYLIALKLANSMGNIGYDRLYTEILNLKELPKKVREVLERNNDIKNIANYLKNFKSVFFIGRGINYSLALEGALKLKEISYIHAEGFAAGELKHGPFALLTKDTPVIAITTKDETYEKMMINIGEVKARGPKVIAIAEDEDFEIENHADFVLRFPSNSLNLSCVPIAVILQLLAYHVANLKGCPIDKPRNLAKSVTVE